MHIDSLALLYPEVNTYIISERPFHLLLREFVS